MFLVVFLIVLGRRTCWLCCRTRFDCGCLVGGLGFVRACRWMILIGLLVGDDVFLRIGRRMIDIMIDWMVLGSCNGFLVVLVLHVMMHGDLVVKETCLILLASMRVLEETRGANTGVVFARVDSVESWDILVKLLRHLGSSLVVRCCCCRLVGFLAGLLLGLLRLGDGDVGLGMFLVHAGMLRGFLGEGINQGVVDSDDDMFGIVVGHGLDEFLDVLLGLRSLDGGR